MVLVSVVMAALLVPLFWATMAVCVLVSLLLTRGNLRLLTADLIGKAEFPLGWRTPKRTYHRHLTPDSAKKWKLG